MATADEVEQMLGAFDEAVKLRDVVAIARLTRDARSADVAAAGCHALRALSLKDDFCPTTEEAQRAVEALLAALRAHPASADVQRVGFYGMDVGA